jgi:hypothetical protein
VAALGDMVVRWRRCGAIAGVAGGQRYGAGARVAGAGSVVWRKEDGWHCQGRREPHRKTRARGDEATMNHSGGLTFSGGGDASWFGSVQ